MGDHEISQERETPSLICWSLQDIEKVGKVAYELVLPPTLAAIHTFFHIFLLKKNVGDLKSIIPLECVDVMYSITYKEVSVEILDERLRNKEVDLVKGLSRSQSLEGPI